MMSGSFCDDVFREDPTIIMLEEKTAKFFGKEAALFCPSGTMTNQIAIKTHTQPGDELICDMNAHIYAHEGGGIAFNSGVQVRLMPGDRGRINAQQIIDNINPTLDWLPKTSLVSLENTVNKAGGSYYALSSIKEIAEICKKNNLKLHLDGARIFNALVETGEKPSDYGQYFDSISVCFSKGLGCPVGSALMGDKEFIRKARRIRKTFGGGMRQAGFLAAAAIYALDNNIKRLKEDHIRAKKIADVLQNTSYVTDLLPVETNIIIFSLKDSWTSETFLKKLEDFNIKGVAFGKKTVRFVTHLDFDNVQLDKTIEAIQKIN